MLRQLKVDVTQRCAFMEGKLVDSVVIDSNLQQGNALFKYLCSKFSTTRSKDSAQCIAAAKDSRLQAKNCAV